MLKPLVFLCLFLLAFPLLVNGEIYFFDEDRLLSEKEDTVSLRNALLKANEFKKDNPDSSFFYFDSALTTADKIIQQKQLPKNDLIDVELEKARALEGLGLYYSNSSDLGNALNYYLQASNIYKELIDSEKEKDRKNKYLDLHGNVTLTIGALYFEEGEYALASGNYSNTLETAKILGDSLMQSKALLNLGMIYNNQGRYDEAIDNYYTAIKIFERAKDKRGIAICHLSIGNILRKQSTTDKAVESYKKALQIFQEMKDERGVSFCYNNLGICYTNKENYEQALFYYTKAVDLHLKNNNERNVALLYTNIAALYEIKGEFDKSIEYIEKSLTINEKNNYKRNLIGSYLNLSGTNLSKLENNQEAVPSSANVLDTIVVYAEKALSLSDSLQLIQEQAAALLVLKKAYFYKRNYKKAYESADLLLERKDSIYNNEKTKIVADAESKYEATEKEQQIEQQKHQLEHQTERLNNARIFRNFLIAVAGLMVVVVVLIYYYYKQKNKANKILDEKNKLIEKQNEEISVQKEELQLTNRELTELIQFKEKMTGMIVHDLKNPLNNILNSYDIDDENFRKELIKQSGYDMLHLTQNILDVYQMEEAKLKLSRTQVDVAQLLKECVMEFALYISENDLKISYPDSEVPLVDADKRLLKRIFSNLLSNAVKYAPQGSNITLNWKITDKKDSRFGVHNNGPAIPREQQSIIFQSFSQHDSREMGVTASTGLGLSFCKMAVHLHGGEIGVTSSDEDGTEFWFTLPQNG